MLGQLASLLGLNTASDAAVEFDSRERLKRIVDRDELDDYSALVREMHG